MSGDGVRNLTLPVTGEAARLRLAAAVFERCRRDLSGGGNYLHSEAQREARAWVEDAGPSFRWWCAVAGRDWRRCRRALLGRH